VELDREMEDAAASLGASPLAIFRRIVLPNILPAVLSGVALAFARAVGEFGALVLISGNLPFRTDAASLVILVRIESGDPGFGVVNALVDLPLALSPVVVGLSLLLLYGRGGWLEGHNVLFALPGMTMATIFVSLPFVVREVVPVLREIGTEQEQAASTLGAS